MWAQQFYFHSTSLRKMQKEKRDKARMTAFILRKTAESLPFSMLNDAEIQKMGTNHYLCVTSSVPVKVLTDSASTQTEANNVPYHDLQLDNELLTTELYSLKQAIDDMTERNRKLEEENNKQRRSLTILEGIEANFSKSIQVQNDRIIAAENKIKILQQQLLFANDENGSLQSTIATLQLQHQPQPNVHQNLQYQQQTPTLNQQHYQPPTPQPQKIAFRRNDSPKASKHRQYSNNHKKASVKPIQCQSCMSFEHKRRDCVFRNYTCDHCGHYGHIIDACLALNPNLEFLPFEC